jgi:hypothetical protein
MHFTAQFIDLKQTIDPVYGARITSDRLAMDHKFSTSLGNAIGLGSLPTYLWPCSGTKHHPSRAW